MEQKYGPKTEEEEGGKMQDAFHGSLGEGVGVGMGAKNKVEGDEDRGDVLGGVERRKEGKGGWDE